MAVQLNEDGFSTFRTGKHIDAMTIEDIAQLESHIQRKISDLISLPDFNPENPNHKLQLEGLKSDRNTIKQKKQQLQGSSGSAPTKESPVENASPTKETIPEEPSATKETGQPQGRTEFLTPQEELQRVREAKESLRKSVEERSSSTLDDGVLEGDFKELDEPQKPAPEPEVKPAPAPEPEHKWGSTTTSNESPGGPPSNPKPTPEQIAKKSKILSGRNMFGTAFVGYDIYSRMKEGEGAVSATAKALGTNALFAALPGGLVGGIAIGVGVTVASMAPELYDVMEGKKAELSGVTDTFNTTFEENEGQIANRQQGMQQQRQAEQYGLDRMRRHARGAHSSY